MPENLALMRQVDEQYTKTPFSGVAWMTLRPLRQGYAVNPQGATSWWAHEVEALFYVLHAQSARSLTCEVRISLTQE